MPPYTSDEALDILRAKLRGNAHAEGYGKVTFKRIDGRTVTFDNVRVDSIGPGGMPYGVIGFETDTEDIVSVPFVESWTVEYRV